MQNLILIKPDMEYADEIWDYRRETLESGGRAHGGSSLARFANAADWIDYCRRAEREETLPDSRLATADQFMLVDADARRVLGLINFRHYLKGDLVEYGGHIGYGVRPSQRRKGYAKRMLRMCLDYAGERGLDKALVTCLTDNEASRRTILSCGGVFERTSTRGDETFERYWITIDPRAKPRG
ncbi:MAG: GNAT family N-acetyltransferase [Oscillospiraceae bacterium]|nr:GNAT family N-acetyltransferase [Oscillospiraceae bacterium]